ncbi:MAG TPA: hypothetical protein VKB96_00025 [Gammaproteobacteria bacterium]|nr:hypothetical protein [Gammaproteobacteria bacterium]
MLTMPVFLFHGFAFAQSTGAAFVRSAENHSQQLLRDGKQIIRFGTFASKEFWGSQLKLRDVAAAIKKVDLSDPATSCCSRPTRSSTNGPVRRNCLADVNSIA